MEHDKHPSLYVMAATNSTGPVMLGAIFSSDETNRLPATLNLNPRPHAAQSACASLTDNMGGYRKHSQHITVYTSPSHHNDRQGLLYIFTFTQL